MILVLLPAYNEEESLPQLMPKLKHTLTEMGEEFKVLICNDGSKVGTQAMLEAYAEKMPIEIILHKINRGLGESSRDLFERAAELV
jgi:dolichol-phosphate mannosyltransferase